MTSVTTPITSRERIQMLDVIRGFALLGILLMNIEYFQRPLTAMLFGLDQSLQGVDRVVGWSVFTFVQGSFYTMFSLLFGMGFVIFYDRAKQREPHPRRLFLRRIVVLALFGMVHLFLIWGGDILLTYAICGLVLALFANSPARRLLKWGISFFLIPVALFWLGAFAMQAALQDPAVAEEVLSDVARTSEQLQAFIVHANEVYASGGYADIYRLRMYELSKLYGTGGVIFFLPTLLGIFLIGASLARSGIFTSFEKRPRAYTHLLRWGLLLGLPAALYIGFYGTRPNMLLPSPGSALTFTIDQVANFGLCFFYISLIALTLRTAERAKRQHWLRHLAPAGRMALTNYLMHSVVFTTLFYGYGFAMYGEISRSVATALAIGLWLLQLPLSRWWLERYRFGPCEWLWRTLTYGERQTFKRVKQAQQ
ncbi:DUF418 domain-containing protein [Pseudidiomarina insulisalsae]|uniref:DUF418 domain-containing protein n=1 Tax=Pseudidiomarina insulisalsae TaxID=575789 RepID=A0A432YMH3_9GAMM|nr:DUF418 domain-containing protein [Pseudidiomarina insulisalsae]RUO62191.1 hypothetical protein CWI71_04895 [Pseudidiomarina insulisalsae]